MNLLPSRRDFLKLAGMLPLGLGARGMLGSGLQPELQNILVIVFDALSAHNISLYGYGRQTTPNLDRLASRAIVYHNHYAASSFTTPGTASLLTGTLPWTHRAMQSRGRMAEPFTTRNLFGACPQHYRIAYTHNGWANVLLKQMQGMLDEFIPWKTLFLNAYDNFIPALFANDTDTATVAWTRDIDVASSGYSYSLFLSHLYNALLESKYERLYAQFPRGLPSNGNVGSEFLLEDAIDWVSGRLPRLPQPFLGYFHFMPPHSPYNTARRFFNRFAQDDFRPPDKPPDIFSGKLSSGDLLRHRLQYDEYILYVDEQLGRLYDSLEAAGLLENTWLVLTSDHGEMFERGTSGHRSDAMNEPVVRVPLVIFEPGRSARQDVHTPTSAIDLLPTVLHLTGQPAAAWSEGRLLPPFEDADYPIERDVIAVKSDQTAMDRPLQRASISLVRGKHKLLYYYGYQQDGGGETARLYDLESDPEEMKDLASGRKALVRQMLEELKKKLEEVNRPYGT
jgi:arylsulfatase A-like enzyme